MNTLKTVVTAIAFSLAGLAVHASAAEVNCSHDAVCFQLTPLSEKTAIPQLAEDGFSRTPLGRRVISAPAAQQTIASDGYSRTPLGKRNEPLQQSAVG